MSFLVPFSDLPLVTVSILAQAAPPENGAPAEGGPRPPGLQSMLFPLAIFLVIWWVVLMMPQQRERKRRQAMLDSLKKNDKVVTTGGMIGTVANVSSDGSEVTLKFGDSVRIPFLRTAIHSVMNESTPAAAATDAKSPATPN